MKVLAQLKALHLYENFIRCADGRAAFAEFLKRQHSDAPVMFLMALDEMNSLTDEEERVEAIRTMVDLFVRVNGEYELNVAGALRSEVLEAVELWESNGNPRDTDLFDSLVCNVHIQLKSEKFSDFRKSDDFQSFIWNKSHELRRQMAAESTENEKPVEEKKNNSLFRSSGDNEDDLVVQPTKVSRSGAFDSKKAIISWTVEEVGMFLEHVGLPQFVEAFEDECIGGDILLDMSEGDLMKLGMKSEHTKMYYDGIDRLSTQQERDLVVHHSSGDMIMIKGYNELTKEVNLIPVSNKKGFTLDNVWNELSISEDLRRSLVLTSLDSDGDEIHITSDAAFTVMLNNCTKTAQPNQTPILKIIVKKK